MNKYYRICRMEWKLTRQEGRFLIQYDLPPVFVTTTEKWWHRFWVDREYFVLQSPILFLEEQEIGACVLTRQVENEEREAKRFLWGGIF